MEIPIILEDFLNYIKTIKGKSSNTVKEYSYDLIIFFKFLKIRYRMLPNDEDFDNIVIFDLDEEILKRVKLEDLHAYISYVDDKRDNKNSTKARKVASIRSFFNYLYDIRKIIDNNPATQLESPKINSRQPIYLSLPEAERLLDTVKEAGGKNKERDYAIITLFLNCGLRLSELVSIDLDKIRGDILTVIGKGDKERTIYLNIACVEAINDYIEVRPKERLKEPKALFISRQRNRLNEKTVQHMVKKYIKLAGLDPDKYSVHKLRHTAATLMYKYGDVDIRALQQILGHENVSTTQIYTHVDDDRLRDAISRNPLANN
ncbi:MAG: tyrosine recombinase XerC [Andreesenia angusta]|nr:tyrosine recombinase XerC [Andreesenia angusta]